MDWLRLLLCGVSVLYPAVMAAAQSEPDRAPTDSDCVIAVTGDVLRPDTYSCAASQVLVLRDLLNTAGLAAESSSVTIIRSGNGQSRSTDFVTRSSSDPGPFLRPGDFVVVRAAGAVDVPVQRNAAILIGKRPVLLSLQSAQVSVGDVLARLQIPPELAFSLQKAAVMTAVARPALHPADVVDHADVIIPVTQNGNSRTGSGGGGGSRGLVPVVSEWQVPEQTAAVISQQVETNSANLVEPVADQQAESVGSVSQSEDAGRGLDADESGASSFMTIPEVTADGPQSDDRTLRPVTTTPPPNHRSPIQFIGGETSVSADSPLISTSMRRATPLIQASETGNISVRETAPIPPAERDQISADRSGIRFWQICCGVLLLASGTMMVSQRNRMLSDAGITADRADPDSPIVIPALLRRENQVDGSGQSELTDPASPPAAIAVVEVVETMAEPAMLSNDKSARESVSNEGLVSDSEWLDGDWRSRLTAAVGQEPCAIKSVAHLEIDQWSHQQQVEVPTPVHSTDAPPRGEVFEELNSLIENRLPIDLTQAQLPLRISIFGRPAGPRRLRVDAAHSTLAGPHVGTSAEKYRAGTQLAGAEKSQSRSGSAKRPLPETTFSAETANATVRDDSFDRALTFLQEQGDR